MKKPGLLDTIKTNLNWGKMFPDEQKIEDANNYYATTTKQHDPSSGLLSTIDVGKDNLKEQPKPGLFQSILTGVGDFINPKIASPIPENNPVKPLTTPEPISPSPTTKPAVLATATPKPQPSGLPEGVTSKNGLVPSVPPQEVSDAISQVFGNEAGKAVVVAFSENGGYRPGAVNKNSDGSVDTGIFQINSNTFNDFMRRKKEQMNNLGINSYEDMTDIHKNALMAKLVRDEQGWGAWYGPKNRGFTIN